MRFFIIFFSQTAKVYIEFGLIIRRKFSSSFFINFIYYFPPIFSDIFLERFHYVFIFNVIIFYCLFYAIFSQFTSVEYFRHNKRVSSLYITLKFKNFRLHLLSTVYSERIVLVSERSTYRIIFHSERFTISFFFPARKFKTRQHRHSTQFPLHH